MTTTTFDDIRAALGVTSSEVPDSDLTFDKELAEGIVTDQLDPVADLPGDQDALDDVAALLAAAFFREEGTIRQLSQGNRQLSFDSAGALGLWRKALMRDPTGDLQRLEASDTSRYTGTAAANSED